MSLEISKWITLILLIGALIFIIKVGMKLVHIVIMVLILGFCWYSFFTGEGSARLGIALNGHPVIAYTTSLQKNEKMSNNNVTYYTSSKDVVIDGKKQKYVKCYNKWIVRLPDIKGEITSY